MKAIFFIFVIIASATAEADTFVRGHVRSDGTYVEPHFRSDANSYKFDNYSSQGNVNPYTGQRGYERNEFSPPSPSYTTPSPYEHTYSNPYNIGE